MAHFVSTLPQEAAQQIDGDKGAEVADVAVVVDRGSAGVHADFVVASGRNSSIVRGKSVEKTKGHGKFERKNLNSRGAAEKGSNRQWWMRRRQSVRVSRRRCRPERRNAVAETMVKVKVARRKVVRAIQTQKMG